MWGMGLPQYFLCKGVDGVHIDWFDEGTYPLRLLDEVHVDDILVVLLSEVLRDICFSALADAHYHKWLVPGLVFPRNEGVFNFPFQHIV